VSFDASPSTPAAIYYEGSWSAVGGTSWSSPLFCSLIAEVVKYDHQRMGNAAPLLYIENQLFGYGPFHDIKLGNNGFSAHSGYDHVTGIGSVRGWTFTQDQAS
jgi:kumamolisin